jgi:cytosine/adenosine deaminase-related metal-dependent hydrolase
MDKEVGSLEVGKAADLVTMDLRRPHLYPPNMPLHRLVCFANGNDVSNVMVGGEMVLSEGRPTRVSEAEILEEAAREAELMIDRIGARADLALPEGIWGREGGQP